MIVIATDSSACMTKTGAHELGVIYVPMTYTLCGKTYTESFIGTNGDFIPLIESEPNPHTSQPAVGRYLRTFKALRKAGFEGLCLTISSRLSGTFSNASACKSSIRACAWRGGSLSFSRLLLQSAFRRFLSSLRS